MIETMDQLRELEPAELDALVARRVMRWERQEPMDDYWSDAAGRLRESVYNWMPSIQIADAFPIAEKLRIALIPSEDGWYAVMADGPDGIEHSHPSAPYHSISIIGRKGEQWQPSATAPMAIVLCALAHAGGEKLNTENAK